MPEKFTKPEQPEEITFEQLQEFINSPELDLPTMRRDISDYSNLLWLGRNLMIRNKEKVPQSYWLTLRKLISERSSKS